MMPDMNFCTGISITEALSIFGPTHPLYLKPFIATCLLMIVLDCIFFTTIMITVSVHDNGRVLRSLLDKSARSRRNRKNAVTVLGHAGVVVMQLTSGILFLTTTSKLLDMQIEEAWTADEQCVTFCIMYTAWQPVCLILGVPELRKELKSKIF